MRKRQLLDANRPIRDRLSAIAQGIDQQSAPYDESRQRLRGIYEAVQKMRAVEKTASARRPLLSRLFNLQDD